MFDVSKVKSTNAARWDDEAPLTVYHLVFVVDTNNTLTYYDETYDINNLLVDSFSFVIDRTANDYLANNIDMFYIFDSLSDARKRKRR